MVLHMTLEEIKKNLDRYKQPIHRANPTAQNYVAAVETLLQMLIEAEMNVAVGKTEELEAYFNDSGRCPNCYGSNEGCLFCTSPTDD